MNLETLFLTLQDKLAALPDLAWIDMNVGQLDTDQRPAVAFPCALISIDLPRCEELGGKLQKCSTQIGIRLGFNYAGATSAKTPEAVRNRALDYYRIIREVYAALQGYSEHGLSRIRRISQTEYATPFQVKVVDMIFYTEFHDYTAQ